ncbi:MAG: DNA-3-methyladenine glycosylase [Rhizobacter sp.]|nr:DNA-3-methyladenine glycosylase [Chlorobiales bacterium]
MITFKKLSPSFYRQPTLDVAKALLGKILVRSIEGGQIAGRIVETEGYIAATDAACHAYRGETARNRSMFGPAGTAYIYRSYGIHWMLNIVTEPEGEAGAVLLRALEPLETLEQNLHTLRRNRANANRALEKKLTVVQLANGPGNLTKAFAIDRRLDGVSLQSDELFIATAPEVSATDVVVTTRVGITQGRALPWRYFIKANPFVSKGRPS